MHTAPVPATMLGSQGTYPNGGTTFVAPLPEDAYFDTNPGRMRLSHDGQHWAGSFQKIVRLMVTDQLEDAPLTMYASRRVEPERGPAIMQKVSGTVTGLTDADLVFEDGYTIPLDDILDIEF